jgi:ABC-type Fe3+/spermidine/putrescine transport system ATPase subunit
MGQIEQVDTPQTIYRRPRTAFVARFLGLSNIVPILSQDVSVAQTPVGSFLIQSEADALLLHSDGLGITQLEKGIAIEGIISELVFAGDSYRVEIQHESGISLTFRIPTRDLGALKVGEHIQVSVAEDYIVPLNGEE